MEEIDTHIVPSFAHSYRMLIFELPQEFRRIALEKIVEFQVQILLGNLSEASRVAHNFEIALSHYAEGVRLGQGSYAAIYAQFLRDLSGAEKKVISKKSGQVESKVVGFLESQKM